MSEKRRRVVRWLAIAEEKEWKRFHVRNIEWVANFFVVATLCVQHSIFISVTLPSLIISNIKYFTRFYATSSIFIVRVPVSTSGMALLLMMKWISCDSELMWTLWMNLKRRNSLTLWFSSHFLCSRQRFIHHNTLCFHLSCVAAARCNNFPHATLISLLLLFIRKMKRKKENYGFHFFSYLVLLPSCALTLFLALCFYVFTIFSFLYLFSVHDKHDDDNIAVKLKKLLIFISLLFLETFLPSSSIS